MIRGENLTARADERPSSLLDIAHNEAWTECRYRGRLLWDALRSAQTVLPLPDHDEVISNLTFWRRAGYWMQLLLPYHFCHPTALLPRIAKIDAYRINFCRSSCEKIRIFSGVDSVYSPHPAVSFYFARDFSFIVNDHMVENSWPRGNSYSFLPDVWPDLVLRECVYAQERDNRSSLSNLQYIVYRELNEPEDLDVIDDVSSRHVSMHAWSGVTGITTFTPADDDFYALLGTWPGSTAAKLLTRHANSYAKKENATNVVTRVKSIRSVRLAGTVPPEDLSPNPQKTVLDNFGFDMIFTLEDIPVPSRE